MARLGRRRRKISLVRALRYAATATPLVRKRQIIETDTRTPQLKRLNLQRRKGVRILRGLRNAPTATPLVRKRWLATNNPQDVAAKVATRVKRHKPRILRARSTPLIPAPPRAYEPKRIVRAGLVRALGWRGRTTTQRAPSTPTATPYVRPWVVVKRDLRAAVWRGLGWRAKIALKAPSVPTPTPLVRKTLALAGDANVRARKRANWFKKRWPEIDRAKLWSYPPTKQPVVRKDRNVLRRAIGWRGVSIALRAPSVPTSTALIRKRLALSPNSNKRAVLRASWLKKRTRFITHPTRTPPLIIQPGHQPIVKRDLRAALRRGLLWRGITPALRARSVPTAVPYIRKALVVKQSIKSRLVRTHAHRPSIKLRSPLVSPPQRKLIVSKRRRIVKARKAFLTRAKIAAVAPKKALLTTRHRRPRRALKTIVVRSKGALSKPRQKQPSVHIRYKPRFKKRCVSVFRNRAIPPTPYIRKSIVVTNNQQRAYEMRMRRTRRTRITSHPYFPPQEVFSEEGMGVISGPLIGTVSGTRGGRASSSRGGRIR